MVVTVRRAGVLFCVVVLFCLKKLLSELFLVADETAEISRALGRDWVLLLGQQAQWWFSLGFPGLWLSSRNPVAAAP